METSGRSKKYNMKKLLLLTITVSLAEFSFSQTDFRKGYIITHARDTLFGLVDYREGDKAHKACDFKESKDQNAITYEPSKIVGYGFVNDKYLESREISMPGQQPKPVFLEAIVRGLISLYKFEKVFFIEGNASGLQQLVNESKEVIVDGKKVLKKTNQHVIINVIYNCG
jgi:hypothetical protein